MDQFNALVNLTHEIGKCDLATQRAIIESLSANDKKVRDFFDTHIIHWETILSLPNSAITEILTMIDRQTLSLALKNSSNEIREAFFRNMNQKSIDVVKEAIEFTGFIKVRDIVDSRDSIAKIIAELDKAGVISVHGSESDYAK